MFGEDFKRQYLKIHFSNNKGEIGRIPSTFQDLQRHYHKIFRIGNTKQQMIGFRHSCADDLDSIFEDLRRQQYRILAGDRFSHQCMNLCDPLKRFFSHGWDSLVLRAFSISPFGTTGNTKEQSFQVTNCSATSRYCKCRFHERNDFLLYSPFCSVKTFKNFRHNVMFSICRH